MKLQRRNTTKFKYYPHYGEESDLNADGEHTGTYEPVYCEPVIYRGSISAPNGETSHAFYGEQLRYTHTLLMDKPDVPIDEQGVISWRGSLYDIVAVRPSLNVLNVALRKRTDLDVSAEGEEAEEEDDDEFCH